MTAAGRATPNTAGAAIPDQWELRKLGELGEWSGGGTPSKANPDYWEAGTIPWVSPKDMKVPVLADAEDKITVAATVESAAKLRPSNCVAVVTRSGILEHTLPVAVVPFEAAYNQDMKVVAPSPTVSAEWLAYALRANETNILQTCRKAGTTVASIDTAKLHEYGLHVPPLDEQREIVAAIEGAFAQIDAIEKELLEVEALVGRLQFVAERDGIRGRLLDSGDETVPGESDRNSDALPPAWREMTLAKVADNLDRMRVPVNRKERDSRVGEVPYYGATGQVGWIDESLFDEDLLLLGEDGVSFLDPRVKKAYRIEGPSWVNNHAHVLRPDRSLVIDEFLEVALNRIDYSGRVNGTTRLKLTQAQMNNLSVPVPPLHEQERIVTKLNEVRDFGDEVHRQVEDGLRLLSGLRRSVLHAAFTGELI